MGTEVTEPKYGGMNARETSFVIAVMIKVICVATAW